MTQAKPVNKMTRDELLDEMLAGEKRKDYATHIRLQWMDVPLFKLRRVVRNQRDNRSFQAPVKE